MADEGALMGRLSRENAVLAGINRIFRETAAARTEEELARICLAVVEDVVGAAFSLLGEMNGERLDLVVSDRGRSAAAARHADSPDAATAAAFAGDSLATRILRDGETVIANGIVSGRGHGRHLPGLPPLHAFLGMPLPANGAISGLIGLGNREGGFRQADADALENLLPAILQVIRAKRTERALQSLVAELQPRVRNILSVVRSVFARTIAGDAPITDRIDHFKARLDSLARTQIMLTQYASGTIDLDELVREELLSVGVQEGTFVRIGGPDVALSITAAETIGLALHELTMNAMKFGALKVPGATLDIRWQIAAKDHGARDLRLSWTEAHVPAVAVDPVHSGFGKDLIERILPYQLGADTSLEFRGGGVHCTIAIPLPAFT